MRNVRLYLDFVSPYTWLALRRAPAFATEHGIRWLPQPVVYAKLLEAHGLTGPAETEARRRYTFHDVARCARRDGLELVGPPAHPFRSLDALRAVCLFGDRPAALELCVELADEAWARGRDLADVRVIAGVVCRVGLDAKDLEDRLRRPGIKAALHRATAGALERGVFGVPTFEIVDEPGELFWGHDRLELLAARLAGRLPRTSPEARAILERPRGVGRRRNAATPGPARHTPGHGDPAGPDDADDPGDAPAGPGNPDPDPEPRPS